MSKKYYKRELREAFFNEMLEQHGDKCMLCEQHVRHLMIDHDHRTGFMRGLLCPKHNSGLGFFNDSPELLRKAADYLEAYRITDEIPEAVVRRLRRIRGPKFEIGEMIDKKNYPTDASKARALMVITGLSFSALKSRVRRERKRLAKFVT